MTATATDLQTEFHRLRDEYRETGEGRYAVACAYNDWFHQSCLEGNPPDALRTNTGSESERFFARTIPGLDGHTYWEGRLERGRFRLDNDARRHRHPRWWWYEHVNGEQERGRLGAVCGEVNCITPDHQQFVPWSEVRQRYTDQQCLGALQVAAQRLGHTPTMHEYRDLKLRPVADIIAVRFGGWASAISGAGLPPVVTIHEVRYTAENCIRAIQTIAEAVGHAPTEDEFRERVPLLRSLGLPCSPHTLRARLGTWREALEKAGLLSSTAPPRTPGAVTPRTRKRRKGRDHLQLDARDRHSCHTAPRHSQPVRTVVCASVASRDPVSPGEDMALRGRGRGRTHTDAVRGAAHLGRRVPTLGRPTLAATTETSSTPGSTSSDRASRPLAVHSSRRRSLERRGFWRLRPLWGPADDARLGRPCRERRPAFAVRTDACCRDRLPAQRLFACVARRSVG